MKKRLFQGTLILLLCVFALLAGGCDQMRNQLQSQEPTQPTVPTTATVTIPEGFAVAEIAEALQKAGVCDAAAFRQAANTPLAEDSLTAVIAAAAGDTARTFFYEGYLFPDTYEFYLDSTPQAALERFLENTRSKLTEEYASRAKALGYSMDEIIVLASIIQEECSIASEMKNVSSVIHNRLDSPDFPRLECDVTGTYLERHVVPYYDNWEVLFKETYNTNYRLGLPAGPICNPGTAAIEAALYPAESTYYYFVTGTPSDSKTDEIQFFYAETYTKHKENCRKVGITWA